MHEAWPGTTKAYLCWVEGAWPDRGWTTIVSDLAKAATAGGEKVVSGQGRRAVSHVHPVSLAAGRSLVLVVLGTGRTHQIRVHLSDRGHAIVGDPKYGRGGGLMLHAAFLSLAGTRLFRPSALDRGFSGFPCLGRNDQRHHHHRSRQGGGFMNERQSSALYWGASLALITT